MIPSFKFDHFQLTPKCDSNCCLSVSPNKIHEVLKNRMHPFDILIGEHSYLLLDKNKTVVLASETFPKTKTENLIGLSLDDIFDKHEFDFWYQLVEKAWNSNECIEVRASENHKVHKIIIKTISNDNDVHGCIISRFPFSTTQNMDESNSEYDQSTPSTSYLS